MSGNLITTIGGVFILIGTAITIFGAYKINSESDAKTEEIAMLAKQNADLSSELKDYATGGESYFYLHVRDFGTDDATALIKHVGNAPVRDVEIMVFDVTDQMLNIGSGLTKEYDLEAASQNVLRADSVYPHGNRKVKRFPFERKPTESFYSYFVHIYASNGTVRQQIQLELVDGDWTQAYVVDRLIAGGAESLTEHFDESFPIGSSGRLLHRSTDSSTASQ